MMSKNITKRLDEIEIIRVFCILSVIGTHFSGTVFSTFKGASLFLFYCLRAYGTIGVVGFFIISGFLYNCKEKKIAKILLKKIKYILIPTYIAAFFNYGILHIYDFSLKEFIIYCYGGGSLYYYITAIMIFYIIFYYVHDNMIILYSMIIINIGSVMLFASDFIMYDQLPYPYLTSYLIPTNWIGFFALGVIVKEKNMWERIVEYLEKYNRFLLFIFIITTFLYVYYCAEIEISYFLYQSIPYEILGISVIIGASRKLIHYNYLKNIGRSSFFTYLYHINIIGFISNRFCIDWYIVLFYPVIILILFWLSSTIIIKLTSKVSYIQKYLFLLGIEEN